MALVPSRWAAWAPTAASSAALPGSSPGGGCGEVSVPWQPEHVAGESSSPGARAESQADEDETRSAERAAATARKELRFMVSYTVSGRVVLEP